MRQCFPLHPASSKTAELSQQFLSTGLFVKLCFLTHSAQAHKGWTVEERQPEKVFFFFLNTPHSLSIWLRLYHIIAQTRWCQLTEEMKRLLLTNQRWQEWLKRSLQLHTGLAMCHLQDKDSGPCVAISIRHEHKGRGEREEACKSWLDDVLFSFCINRLDFFYETVTLDQV